MIFPKLHSEDKAGLYLTVILHLLLLLVLLIWQISKEIAAENTFVMDFTRQEELERQEAEKAFKEDISERIDRMLREQRMEVRNIAVDAGSNAPLKDDRGTDAQRLYEEAERLRKELLEGQKAPQEEVEIGRKDAPQEKKQEEESSYRGPSVLYYSLEGRKATRLKIPAYQCYGGGQVTVLIAVDTAGNVKEAKIKEDESSSDQCLRDFARRAALASRFSASPTAPHRQYGTICYSFVAQ